MQEQSERTRLEDRARRDYEELGMPYDDNVMLYHEATAGIRKLSSIVDSTKRLRLGGLPKVMVRNTTMATTGASILTSMRAKRYRQEIYRGSGVQSVQGKPYVPFEVGVGFEESSAACEKQVAAIQAHRTAFKHPNEVEESPGIMNMTEIELNRWYPVPDSLTSKEKWVEAKRYERKIFYLDLAKYPRSQTRGKSVSVTLESEKGDPDLYMAIAEAPTEKEYTWRSVREGSDVILIHPKDPNYVLGIYYIGVSCPSSDSSFRVRSGQKHQRRSNPAIFNEMSALSHPRPYKYTTKVDKLIHK